MIAQMKMLPQIILATIDYSEFESEMETPANVIILSEKRKLLNSNDFVENQDRKLDGPSSWPHRV